MLDNIKALNAYELANHANCVCPDSLESPGALFLIGVRDDFVERWCEDLNMVEGMTASECVKVFRDFDIPQVIADNAPSVYTHPVVLQCVDLCAYREDLSELRAKNNTMEDDARLSLYIVAERLVNALLGMLTDESDNIIINEANQPTLAEIHANCEARWCNIASDFYPPCPNSENE